MEFDIELIYKGIKMNFMDLEGPDLEHMQPANLVELCLFQKSFETDSLSKRVKTN